jgi:abequosyltransferase
MEQSARAGVSVAQPPKLSICISTLNRADFLRATLNQILPQLTDQCEVLVVDNASVDNTPHVVAELTHDRLRCIRKEDNKGLDGNFDRAIELARGDYCWLTSDDDLFHPGAVAAVLAAIADEPSAVLVNYEFRDFSMSKVLQERVLDLDADRVYGPWELDRMFVELGDFVRYIGALVMRRTLWLERQRNLYIGSYYGFVGMLYQERLPRGAYVIAQPYVSYRYGNEGTYSEQLMEIVFAKWPSLVASLPLAERSKCALASAQPWRHIHELFFWRGNGRYSYGQYRRWIRPQLHSRSARVLPLVCAVLPRLLVNALLALYLAARRNRLRQMDGLKLAMLEASPFHFRTRTPRKRAQTPTPTPTMT